MAEVGLADRAIRTKGRTSADWLPELRAANRAWADKYRPIVRQADERKAVERKEAQAALSAVLARAVATEKERASIGRYWPLAIDAGDSGGEARAMLNALLEEGK